MTDVKRPPAMYPRTMLSWLVGSVLIATLCVLGLSVVVLILGRAVGHLADQRKADQVAAVRQSDAEIHEIERLRRVIRNLGGNPGPRKFHPASPGAAVGAVPPPAEQEAPAPRPAPQPTPTSTHRPTSARPSPHPTSARPSPHPVRSCVTHPLKCLPVSTIGYHDLRGGGPFPTEPASIRTFLRHREPAGTVVNALRGVVVIFGACYTGWVLGRWRRIGATCREGKAMHIALLVMWLPLWLTEAEQIGLAWLPWRLPVALAAIPATIWFERVHTQLHHPGAGVSDRLEKLFGRTLRRSAD